MKSNFKKLASLNNLNLIRNFFFFILSLGVSAAILYVLINSPA